MDRKRNFKNFLTENEGCTCQNCNRKYKIDFLLPDDIWLKISPKKSESGLLCGSCIAKKLETIDNYNSFKLTKI